MFSLEHWVVGALVLLFFGHRRLPALGAVLGKTVRNFREHKSTEPGQKIIEPEFKRVGNNASESN